MQVDILSSILTMLRGKLLDMPLQNRASSLALTLLISGLIVWFVNWIFRKLSGFGGAPQEEGSATHYRLKPMMRFLLLALAGVGIADLWYGVKAVRKGTLTPGIIHTSVGIAAITLTIMTAGAEIILDEQGLRSRTSICSGKIIPWNNLSHVEKLYNIRAVTNNYYFRSTQGTTIVVGDSSFDAGDLLQRIRARQPLSEQPYKRRKWYGG